MPSTFAFFAFGIVVPLARGIGVFKRSTVRLRGQGFKGGSKSMQKELAEGLGQFFLRARDAQRHPQARQRYRTCASEQGWDSFWLPLPERSQDTKTTSVALSIPPLTD